MKKNERTKPYLIAGVCLADIICTGVGALCAVPLAKGVPIVEEFHVKVWNGHHQCEYDHWYAIANEGPPLSGT